MATDSLTYILRFDVVDAATAAKVNKIVRSIDGVSKVSKTAATSTKSLAGGMAQLALRAALVVPIWMAIRTVMMSSIGTMRDTISSIVEIDKALQFAKNELIGFADAGNILDSVRAKAEELAVTFGTSVASNIEVFRLFKTAGIEVEASLAGMQTAIAGSVATQSDATELGKLLADVYNLMGNSITEVEGPTNKMNYILSTMTALMPTNVIQINEFTAALRNVTSTGAVAGLTLDQLFTLIAVSATTMERGARGGTRLGQTLRLLTKNIDDVGGFLGRDVNLNRENIFDILIETLREADTKLKGGVGGGKILKDLVDIFGARAGQLGAGLAVNFERLNKELQTLAALSPEERFAVLQERVDNATASMNIQLKILKQLREEIGREFIVELTGGTDFAAVIEDFNKNLDGSRNTIIQIAADLRTVYELMKKIAAARPLTDRQEEGQGSWGDQVLNNISFDAPLRWLKMSRELDEVQQKRIDGNETLLNQIHRLDIAQKRAAAGLPTLDFEELFPPLPPEPTKTELASESTQSFKDEFGDEREKITKAIIKNRLAELKIQGALNSELLKAEGYLNKQLNTDESIIDKAIRKLLIEQSISEEKRFQNQLGSDSLKLFEISQTEGVDIAKKIGDFQAGDMDLEMFARIGGKAFEVYKEKFAQEFKERQAEQFFRGERVTGAPDLRGGANIDILEENIRKDGARRFDAGAALDLSKLESLFLKLTEKETKDVEKIPWNEQIQALEKNNTSLDTLNLTISDLILTMEREGTLTEYDPNNESFFQMLQSMLFKGKLVTEGPGSSLYDPLVSTVDKTVQAARTGQSTAKLDAFARESNFSFVPTAAETPKLKQTIDVNINLDGAKIENISGTPEQVATATIEVSNKIAEIVRKSIIDNIPKAGTPENRALSEALGGKDQRGL